MSQSDQEQVELLRKWWQDNGLSLIGGLVIGVGGILGWQYYGQYQAEQAATAAVSYDAILASLDDAKLPAARATVDELASRFDGSPYVPQARLAVAQALAQSGDWPAATQQLDLALQQAADPALQALIRLRLARSHWAQANGDQALSLLRENAPEAFAPLYAELKGDIAVAKGDVELARSAYTDALGSGLDYVDSGALAQKLAALPKVETP